MKVIKILLAIILLLVGPATFAGITSPIGKGEFFPDMVLDKPLGSEAAAYLGIPGNVGFSLSHVQADLVVVEFLSVYCPHCQRQVEHFNRLLELIEGDPATRGRIKLLGIAVASKTPEVEKFITNFKVAYPMVPDPNFQLYHAVSASLTPFSVYVRRTAPGQAGVVAATHTGLIDKPEKLLAELRHFADSYPDELQKLAKDKVAGSMTLASVIPDEELETRLVSTFARLGGGAITTFSPLDLPSKRKVYMADTLEGESPRRFFAEVVARHSICDICHDVHFLYVFDSLGKILAFDPIQLTKWGNKPWTQADVSKMRARLVGSNLGKPLVFNADIDAVTSATITSAVVFDAVNQGEELLQELSDKGFLNK